jgi:hypothetical protein
MRVDRIFPTARNLWREQPRWRWTTVAAALTTVAALFTGGPGGIPGGGGPGQSAGTTYPPTTMPGGGGGGPTIVMPGPPADLDAESRLRVLYQAHVDAEAIRAQAGLRCEKLAAAYGKLEPDDEAKAKKPLVIAAIEDAKRCNVEIADSDPRVDTVAQAVQRFKQSPTLAAAETVDGAAAALTEFDRSRDLAAKGVTLEQLDKLKTAIATYRQLLERMATLAPLYRSRDPATIATAVELAKLRQDAIAFPFVADGTGLTAPQQQALNAAAGADEAIRASDHKIGILQEAFARRSADPVGLTIALGALDPFDRARLQAAQTGLNLQEAETAARASIGQAIARLAGDYATSATYANALLLAQLAALADSLKADIPADAKAVVGRAQADLAGSAKRLKALNDVAARWRQLRAQGTRDPAVETRVNQVIAAIVPAGSVEANSFDAAAMTPQDRAALGTVISALIEVQGQLLPGQRRAVTVALRGPATANAASTTLLANVAAELQRLGFAVTNAAAGADTTLLLNLSAPALTGDGINAAGLYQRQASVTGTLQWAYSGRTADLGTITGVGADRDRRAITEAALRAAAAEVGKALLAKVQGE